MKPPLNQIAVVFLLYTFLASCTSDGHRGTSSSVEDAKEREVFIQEYYAVPNPIIINDTLQFEISEAWSEYQWRHSYDSENNTAKYDAFELRINTVSDLPERLGFTWSISAEFAEHSLRPCNRDCLIGDFDQPPPDTIVYPVIQGRLLKNDTIAEKEILGEIKLIAK
jgi:hypothetical protein